MEHNTEFEKEVEQKEELTSDQEASKEEVSENDSLQKVKDDLAEAKDKYLRLYSEFENFRRRTSREKLEMIQTANEGLIKALLPVMDDFERAQKVMQGKEENLDEGYALIHQKLKKILELQGVKTMDIGVGSAFNADTQEAISQLPAPEENLKGKIIEVVEPGYLLQEKVIRYAKVVVGN